MFICNICKSECLHIGKHLRNSHKNISNKEYYDKYIKKENEGLCLVCRKPTRFVNAVVGYKKYCSNKCSSVSSNRKLKYVETCLKKYGTDNASKNKEIKSKIQETFLKKYGTKFIFQNELIKNKIKKTNLLKYKNEFSSQSDIIKQKVRKTVFEKYGKSSYLQTDECKERRNVILNENLRKEINNICNRNSLILLDMKKDLLKLNCLKCDKVFTIQRQLFWKRYNSNLIICNICNPYEKPISNLESELVNFIKNNYDKEIITNSKQIISPDELDIYLPDIKLAFEFNGLYWHNEFNKPKDYHLNKTELCERKGIRLIHIYEDDWIYKQNIVKSRILNLLGKSNKIYARDCEIRIVNYNDCKNFLDKSHIQGFVNSKINIGLYYYDNELVSLMTFGSLRRNLGQVSKEDHYELLRFCNKLNHTVIGGANKLFSYFVDKYKPTYIVSYADRSWTMNNSKTLYDKLGFKMVGSTLPNYSYIVDGMRKNRFKFRKDVLVNGGYDANKSEHEIMFERGYYRIYDSGNLKYVWKRL